MPEKKVDWDFRFIMSVFTLSALFGAWLFTKGYPAEWQAIKDAVAWPFERIGAALGGMSNTLIVVTSLLVIATALLSISNIQNGSRR